MQAEIVQWETEVSATRPSETAVLHQIQKPKVSACLIDRTYNKYKLPTYNK